MIRPIAIFLQAVCLLLVPLHAGAVGSPDALVQNVTNDVLAVLREDRGLKTDGHRKAIRIIEQKIAPHFDFQRMTRLAVGRGWRDASPTQRKQLTQAFRTLLVRTYANALTRYRDQTVHFDPPAAPRQGDEVVVRSEIRQPGAQPIDLDYRLAENGGQWKVFDVSVAGVSLVTTYRSSFASELARGGTDGLIQALRKRNDRLANGGAAGS
ncbi:ABC transporter substrate-binding protein [Nitrogeniibacter mangrovi]|uniref:ABC transporter substrate-binding protein n=1 Tax=Nitrogeniibacter mangrovi TaxID=2016596 RepID=A0A6C1B7Q0_9RHOO|nr:ABC transporter substrate-binding protein [Nitrogeniibacter mangrovi]QID19507.1 ABC transporter substrate-binding protein [Nitrogeniibacter mangrovi]